ncbi:nicotinamide-nucleotide amidohydrolase family protein [Erwinia sp. CPCC 100877]|nr:nicotinamide-nucleotide amidohydrolase family protein [Erwinia sp. CPCC 100877]
MVQPWLSNANKLGQLLIKKKLSLATAESCTGGLIASSLCAVEGTPLFYAGGYVTFNNRAKATILGVKPETLSKYTAVSSQAVKEMAAGARLHSGADMSVKDKAYIA